MNRQRLVIGVTGSSAPQLAWAVLGALHASQAVETHLVLSAGAEKTIEAEMGLTRDSFEALADVSHHPSDMGAAVSSGSFQTMGMVVVPCSMKTLASIATGVSSDLVARAADVCLKERRRLILVTRETPFNLIHIRNMETATLAGATILPPVPAFYHQPKTIDDLLNQTAGKILDQFAIGHTLFRRWDGTTPARECIAGALVFIHSSRPAVAACRWKFRFPAQRPHLPGSRKRLLGAWRPVLSGRSPIERLRRRI
jgi:polyprenyl P-hydroxybenzoate/phenylacrylic acid decarboxylase-like protein